MERQQVIGIVLMVIGIVLLVASITLKIVFKDSMDSAIWEPIGEAAWLPKYGNAVVFNYTLYKNTNVYRTLYKIIKNNDPSEQYYLADNNKPTNGSTMRLYRPTHPELTTLIVRV